MSKYLSRLGSISLLLVAACGGGGGGGGGSSTVAPSNLEYPRPVGLYTVDVPTAANTPTYDGSPATFSVSPQLPDGISMNTQTGSITGTPTQPAARETHTVTATNSAGFTTTTLTLGVALPARFAYIVNQADSTITMCTVDAATGQLNHIGYQPAPVGQVGPERMVVHANGRFAFVPNLNSNNMSVYSIDTAEGWLTAGTPVSLGTGPHYVTIEPTGRFVYVMS